MKKISKKKFLKGLGMLAAVGFVSIVCKGTGIAAKQPNKLRYSKLVRKELRAVRRDGCCV